MLLFIDENVRLVQMAGHSHASNVMHKKNMMDKRKAKVFTKIARDLTNAARNWGADPDSNPRLKTLLDYAKYLNFPKDNIQRAIQKSQGGADSEPLVYECFAGNVAIVIVANTDNRNRLSSQIRAVLRPAGGDFGKCMYLFTHLVRFMYSNTAEMLERLLSCECELIDINVNEDKEMLVVDFDPTLVTKVEICCGLPLSREECYKPFDVMNLDDREKIDEALDEIDEIDDVESVFCNIER